MKEGVNMAKESTCCFTGHRVIGSDFSPSVLKRGINYLIEQGVDTFIVGGALGFDTICAKEILKAKKAHPQIKLHIYAPCNNQSEKWSVLDTLSYNKILKKADYVDMPDFPYFDGCMKIRNYKMVDSSAFCLCYLSSSTRSGTAQTVRYAKEKGLTIFNIAGKK